ncbi:MAG TPA: DNA-processing protein DprA [Longimicrobiales bacterium]
MITDPRELRAALEFGWRFEPDRAARARRVEHGLRLIERGDVCVIAGADPRLPVAVSRLHVPPRWLYVRGRMELLERPVLAIVGTRRCTREGREFAHEVAHAVVSAGGAVLSGLALGIDGAAHQAALPDTIAVLGAGIDLHQPPSHGALQERIGAEGLLITEYPPASEAVPWHFPERNRLIAALSKAVFVVEAPERSGALITADHALDLGVELFAAPGPPRRRANVGSNQLMQDGAGIVIEPRDALDALGLTPPKPKRKHFQGDDQRALALVAEPTGLDPSALAIWRAAEQPGHADDLAARAELPTAATLSALLELEVMGLVTRRGQRYERV